MYISCKLVSVSKDLRRMFLIRSASALSMSPDRKYTSGWSAFSRRVFAVLHRVEQNFVSPRLYPSNFLLHHLQLNILKSPLAAALTVTYIVTHKRPFVNSCYRIGNNSRPTFSPCVAPLMNQGGWGIKIASVARSRGEGALVFLAVRPVFSQVKKRRG